MNRAEHIRVEADKKRAIINEEMAGVADLLKDMTLTFPARASETGRLYGSINARMIVDAVNEKAGTELTHRQVDTQPLRMIGEHTVNIRLTVDLIPEIKVIVHREGETVQQALEEAAELIEAELEASTFDTEVVEEPTIEVELSEQEEDEETTEA
jgi:large subunit ribosomal protein L9